MICAPKFTTRIDVREAIGRVSLIGELDLATVPVLDDHLTRFQGAGITEIILDLRELTLIDSSGVHVILRARLARR